MKYFLAFFFVCTAIATAAPSGGPMILTTGGTISQPVSSAEFADANGLVKASSLGTNIQTALVKPANAQNGVVVSDLANALHHGISFGIGSTTGSVIVMGDSLVSGSGVSDPRQTTPAILSSLGFCQNKPVYTFGFSGYFEGSLDSIFATNQSIFKWSPGSITPTTVSTCPGNFGSGDILVLLASGNAYNGIMLNGTCNGTTSVTGLSLNNYGTDGAGGVKPIAAGNAVTGTGVPVNTVVVTPPSGGMVILSNAVPSGTVLLTFTPAVGAGSYFSTHFLSIIGKAHTLGMYVVVVTIQPANNQTGLVDGQNSQGYFQSNRLLENAYVRGLTTGGGGSNPDLVCDAALMPEFGSFNANYMAADQLHPNGAGNLVYGQKLNADLLIALGSTTQRNPFASEGITRPMLPTAAVYNDTDPNFSSNSVTLRPPVTSSSPGQYIVYGGQGGSTQAPDQILFKGGVGADHTDVVIQDSATGLSAGNFSIGDTNGNTIFYYDHAANGNIILGSLGTGAGTAAGKTGTMQFRNKGGYIWSDAETGGNLTCTLNAAGGLIINSNHNSGGTGASNSKAVVIGGPSGSTGGLMGINTGGDNGVVFENTTTGLPIHFQNGANVDWVHIGSSGGLFVDTVGQTLFLKGGTNGASGQVTLSSGVGTITSSAITSNSVISFSKPGTSSPGAGQFQPSATCTTGTAFISGSSTDSGTWVWATVQGNQ